MTWVNGEAIDWILEDSEVGSIRHSDQVASHKWLVDNLFWVLVEGDADLCNQGETGEGGSGKWETPVGRSYSRGPSRWLNVWIWGTMKRSGLEIEIWKCSSCCQCPPLHLTISVHLGPSPLCQWLPSEATLPVFMAGWKCWGINVPWE